MADFDIDDVDLGPEDIKPNGTRLLVRRRQGREVSKGGIIIPQTSQAPDYVARVCAVGDAVEAFKVGDWVMLGRWNAARFRLLENKVATNDRDAYKEYALIDIEDVYAKILIDIPEGTNGNK